MRLLARVLVAVLAARGLGGQTAAPPKFEIADVHLSASTNTNMRRYNPRDGWYEMRNAAMVDLIAAAYGVDNDKVLGGPSWLEWDRFDVIARLPLDATIQTARPMLQTLLADRFQLMVHKDTSPVLSFALMVGKGKPKLNAAHGGGLSACQPAPQPNGLFRGLACHGVSMDLFARTLRGYASDYFDAAVVDSTGLKGSWDFDLKWTPRGQLARAGHDGITIFDALEQQLGLRAERQQIASAVMVVDNVKETPSPNTPEAAKLLSTAVPAEFEVADVKLSPPEARRMARLQNGRLDIEGFSLQELIRIAWDMQNDDRIANEPKGLESVHVSVVAKAFTSGPAFPVDFDDIRIMLRGLLVERFKLATHMENRLVPGYTLLAGKPKIEKADPASRTGCKEGLPPDAEGPGGAKEKDPRDVTPMLARLVTCRNITMAQFASVVPNIASGYIHNGVVDGTGLAGAWDFTLSFSPIGLYRNAGRRSSDASALTGVAAAASDPSGALSLFDAVKKLGLRLEPQKRMMPVLVIDHVESRPTEN